MKYRTSVPNRAAGGYARAARHSAAQRRAWSRLGGRPPAAVQYGMSEAEKRQWLDERKRERGEKIFADNQGRMSHD